MRKTAMDLDDAVVEALYEYGCNSMNEVLRHVRRRIGRVDEGFVRQCYQELTNKQQAILGS